MIGCRRECCSSSECYTVQTLLKVWGCGGLWGLVVVEEQIAASEAMGLIRVAWRLLVLNKCLSLWLCEGLSVAEPFDLIKQIDVINKYLGHALINIDTTFS